jgi:hypothetical protein
MPKQLTSRIASIKAKQEALAARLNTLEMQAKKEDRKRDTRRKIIVGGAVLVAMEKDEALAARIKDILAQTVGRAMDKEVIADLLPPSPAPASDTASLENPATVAHGKAKSEAESDAKIEPKIAPTTESKMESQAGPA